MDAMGVTTDDISGGGSGRSLPKPLLFSAAACALFATGFSFYSINQQLRAYRKPVLQRYVVRLLLMVPIYSLSSMSSLFSLQAAFVIDVIRDVYEGFVIWSFFSLLVEYLGGERSLLILVHGRKPTPHPFPFNLFFKPLDISDPYSFLGLKRGVLQYVQLKPILAAATILLKSLGKYDDGKLAWDNGYTWISITYNFSVFLSLYCLGMFWAGLSEDLAPFRVTSKFLCVKGIIFFSFWQGFGVSILVAAGIIKQIGPVRDEEYLGLAVQDMLICLEMPLFALSHAYAFSPKDYIDPFSRFQSRLPAIYALRDSLGMYDVISDSLMTIRGTGYGYQTFEPSEGVMHQSLGRNRRVRAGLRYTQGGKAKYWLPLRGSAEASSESMWARHQGPARQFRRWLDRKRMEREGYAPLLQEEVREAVHEDPDLEQGSHISQNHTADPLGVYQSTRVDQGGSSNEEQEQTDADDEPRTIFGRARQWAAVHAQASLEYLDQAGDAHEDVEEAAALQFSDVNSASEEEQLYEKSRALKHGDYAFPAVDVQEEEARSKRFKEDDELLKRYRAQKGQRARVGRARGRKEGEAEAEGEQAKHPESNGDDDNGDGKQKKKPAPPGVVDLLVEDSQAEERERLRERRRGDPALRAGGRTRVFRRQWAAQQEPAASGSSEPGDAKARPTLEPEEMPKRQKSRPQADIQEDAQRTQHPDAHDHVGAARHEQGKMPAMMQKRDDEGQVQHVPQPSSHEPVETGTSGERGIISGTIDRPKPPSPSSPATASSLE